MTLDADRIRVLHAAKLRVLTRTVLDVELAEVSGTDDGALAVTAGAEPAVVCLAQERPERALGGALALAIRSGCDAVHVFADDHSGLLARRAVCFTKPPSVWQIQGDTAVHAEPSPRPTESAPPRVPELVALLASAGVEIAVEHGVITGEVEGLEVARIVASAAATGASSTDESPGDGDPDSGDAPAVAWQIEVGVGAHDREAFALLHADEPTAEAIRRVADVVRTHRCAGASPHPLNRMGAARWLRSLLIRRPDLVRAGRLRAASPPVERGGPKDSSPAVAYGLTPDGRRIVVVAGVGIDLDVVPFAADARLFLDPDAELAVAVPQRDAHEVIRAMAERLDNPAEIVEIDDGWRTFSGEST
ncbi:hypothetical protein [Candidatus Poriferisodalis sp.]|uniref:hypothetical protein n=1 Tax=Candidatus Poriferisodalis sp. TaxID=3101277 RepID=UPI003B021E49